MTSEQVVQLDPAHVLADDNSKWGKKPRETDVQMLMDSILEQGGVMEPVEVAELTGDPAHSHRLTYGFTRHAAVTRLNNEQGAGLLLPCIVRSVEEGAARIKRQVAENVDRGMLSPMDKAVAIQRLLESGQSKADIRRTFSSAGGTKGSTVQPMSNAMLNILLNLLDLPKGIQEDIHLGLIGVEGAYMLGKVPADKRQAVVDRAKKDWQAQAALEQKDEAKYLATEKKVTDTEARVVAAETKLEKARGTVSAAEELVKQRIGEMKAVKVEIAESEEPAGPKEREATLAAEANVKAAQKVLKEAKEEATKVATAKSEAQTAVEQVRAKLEASRKATKKRAIGKAAVTKAAKAVGTTPGVVPLKIVEVRQMFKDMAAGKLEADDRIVMMAKAILHCLNGNGTDKELVAVLNRLLDRMGAKLPPPPAKPTPPAPEQTGLKTATPPVAPDVKQGPKAVAKQ